MDRKIEHENDVVEEREKSRVGTFDGECRGEIEEQAQLVQASTISPVQPPEKRKPDDSRP
jgi:hypothetical protein